MTVYKYICRCITLLISLYLVLYFVNVRYFEGMGLYITIIKLFVGFLCFLYLVWISRVSHLEIFCTLIFLLMSIIPGTAHVSGGAIVINTYGLVSGFLIVSAYFMAKHVTLNGSENLFAMLTFCVIFLSYFIYAGFSGDYFATGFFVGSSYNFISTIFIYSGVLVAAVYSNDNSRVFLVLAIVTLVCFILYARSSMVISILLLMWWVAFRVRFSYIAIFLVMLSIGLLFLWPTVLNIYSQTKFSNSGLNSARWEMWQSYFSVLDWKSFLFGLDLSSVDIIKDYGGNPHNSFIRFHSMFGIIGIGFLVCFLVYSCLAVRPFLPV